MSRIFDAIQRGHNDITRTIVDALGADTKPEETPTVEKMMQNVLSSLDAPHVPASTPQDVPAPAPPSIAATTAAAVRPVNLLTTNTVRIAPLIVSERSPLFPFDTANWRASEQYRTIRTRILQHPSQPRLIAVSSAGAGDGKSVTAINIAGALSLKSEADVLLLDMDFRRSTLHKSLSIPRTPGLTDILLDRCTLEQALLSAEQYRNLYILPVGTPVENPSDLLETSRWKALREEISALFQYTVLDCPPVGAVSEWDLILSAADAAIIVGRQDHTKFHEFLKAVEAAPREKLIGVVLNCVSDWFLVRPYSSYDYPRMSE